MEKILTYHLRLGLNQLKVATWPNKTNTYRTSSGEQAQSQGLPQKLSQGARTAVRCGLTGHWDADCGRWRQNCNDALDGCAQTKPPTGYVPDLLPLVGTRVKNASSVIKSQGYCLRKDICGSNCRGWEFWLVLGSRIEVGGKWNQASPW